MRQGFGALTLALFLLLVLWTKTGDGNQGSAAGSCYCRTIILSGTTPRSGILDHIRQHLKTYNRCRSFIRFNLPSNSVCGGKGAPWVQELVSCFDNKECGKDHGKSLHHQKHLPHASTRMPVPTEGTPPDTGTLAQIQSTQQSTFPSGELPLTRELTQHSETTALTSGYDPEARPEANANKEQQEDKQLKENPGASAGTSARVPVLSLLAIVFLLTAATVYMWCNRRQRQQSSADLQLHYALVNQDSKA